MSDEIRQELGFDASQAIETLKTLNRQLSTFESRVSKAAQSLNLFNRAGPAMSSTLSKLSKDAASADAAMKKLGTQRGRKQSPVSEKDVATVEEYTNRLERMYQLPKDVPKQYRYTRASKITRTAELAVKSKISLEDLTHAANNLDQVYTGSMGRVVDQLRSLDRASVRHLGSARREAERYQQSINRLRTVSEFTGEMQKLYPVAPDASQEQRFDMASRIAKASELAARSGMSMQQLIEMSQNLDKVYSGASAKVADELRSLDKAANRHIRNSKQAIHELTVSWQTMMRVISTQVIVRAIYGIQRAITSTLSSTIKFQRTLAEISTISPDKGLSQLNEVVSGISAEYNMPLLDTAEAYYQTISNQIGTVTGEYREFMQTSAEFSKVTKTDLADSVNVLSGVLNSYDMSVEQASVQSANLFKTIEYGRTRAKELSDTLGTILPLARNLGVGIEEVNAATATLTINGIKTNKAMTQLRGTFNAFLKPTSKLTEVMRELGFDTGEQLLRAYSLSDALQLIASRTDGTSEAMAELFPRIRGLSGVMTLINDKGEHFGKVMEVQKDALASFNDELARMRSTDVERLTKEWNKISVFFTGELGPALTRTLVKYTDLVGGAENFTLAVESTLSVLPRFTQGVLVLAAAMTALALKAKWAKGEMTMLQKAGAVFVAAGAAVVAGKFIGEKINQSMTREYDEFKDLMEKQVKQRRIKAQKEIEIERQKTTAIIREMSRVLSKSQRAYFESTEALANQSKRLVSDVRYYTDQIITIESGRAQALRSKLESLGDDILDSEERVYDARITLEDRLFEHRIKRYKDSRKIAELSSRAQQLAVKATQGLGASKTEEQRDAALKQFERARGFTEQALSTAEQAGNRALEAKALRQLEGLTRSLARAEKQYQQNVRGSKEQLIERAKQQEDRVKRLKDKQTELLDAFRLYDEKTGELLPADERARKVAEAQRKMREFVDLSGETLRASDILDFASLSSQLENELQTVYIQKLKVSDEGLRDLAAQIEAAVNRAFANNPAARVLGEATGIEVTGPESQEAAIKEFQRLQDTALKTKSDLAKQSEQMVKNRLLLDKSISEAEKVVGPGDAPNLNEALEKAKEFRRTGEASREDLLRLTEDLKREYSSLSILQRKWDASEYTRVGDVIENMARMLNNQEAIQGILDESSLDDSAQQKALEYVDVLQRMQSEAYRAKEALKSTFETQFDYAPISQLTWAIQFYSDAVADRGLDTSGFQGAIDFFRVMEEQVSGANVSLERLQQAQEGFQAAQQSDVFQKYVDDDSINRMQRVSEELQRVIDTRQRLKGVRDQPIPIPHTEQYQQLERVLDKSKQDAREVGKSISMVAPAVGDALSPLASMSAAWSRIRMDAEATARAASLANTQLPAGNTQLPAGNTRYLAAGGLARGTDQVPAVLSPGEFVVNQRSSNRFFSQLQAINSGTQPAYQDSGSAVTNIGDVTINVTESQNGQQTGRQVMQMLRREMRRGASRF